MRFRRGAAIFTLCCFLMQQMAISAEVLMDTGQRQTVVERTKQYAGTVDAVKLRSQMSAVFKKNLKKGNGTTISGVGSKCNGYTVSSCGLSCCGKAECENVCKANTALAHGNTCLSSYRTSSCGMSCCGKQDCETVCDNYRTSRESSKNCGGYVKTPTGESCCGYEDCRKRSCGGYTSVFSNDYGKALECCGEKNCRDVKCDYQTSTEVISGGVTQCCGKKDCYSKYCDGKTSVDSKIDLDKKNLQCCGSLNCHNVECDGYVTVKGPNGQKQCCGYDDCRKKECEERLVVKNQLGQMEACCGIKECGNIAEARTYEEPDPNGGGLKDIETYYTHTYTSGCCNTCGYCAHKTYTKRGPTLRLRFNVPNAKVQVRTGVDTKIPAGCTQTSMEQYDGTKYYHYKCKKSLNYIADKVTCLRPDAGRTCRNKVGKNYNNLCCLGGFKAGSFSCNSGWVSATVVGCWEP